MEKPVAGTFCPVKRSTSHHTPARDSEADGWRIVDAGIVIRLRRRGRVYYSRATVETNADTLGAEPRGPLHNPTCSNSCKPLNLARSDTSFPRPQHVLYE